MEQLLEHDSPQPKKRRRRPVRLFLRNQFRGEGTSSQGLFDLLFGVVMPVVCLRCDPLVFRTAMGYGEPMLGSHRVLGYSFIVVEMGLFLLWYLGRTRLGGWNAVVGGAMVVGGVFAFLIGVVLLPISLIGLFALIGILGFTPLLTGFVFVRCGVRAIRRGRQSWSRVSIVTAACLGALVIVGVPVAIQVKAESVFDAAVADILSGDAERYETGIERLEPWVGLIDMKRMVWMSKEGMDSAERATLRTAFERLTGENFNRVMWSAFD